MRRLIIVLGAIVVLLAAASPATAAPPTRQSGTFESAGAFGSACATQGSWVTCTDVSVDLFVDSTFEFSSACVWVASYRVRTNGTGFRVIDEQQACGPADGATVAEDVSSATLPPSILESSGGSISVAGTWTAVGDPVPFSSRSTFKDGTCTFTQTSDGERAEAVATVTVDGTTYESLFATIAREEVTFSERCR